MAAIANGLRTALPARTAVKPRAKSVARPHAASREFFYVQEIDNSRVRRQSDPRERRAVLLYVAMFALACTAFLAFAWQQFAILQDGYTISELQDKRDSLVQANRMLESQDAALRTSDRISRYAKNNLGLVPPKEGQVVRLENPLPAESEPVMARLQVQPRH
jgi:cell division protein FtsL